MVNFVNNAFLHFSSLSNILKFYHLLTTYQSHSRNFKTRVKFTFFVAKTFAEMSTCNYQYNIFISQPLSSVNSHMYHLYLAFRNFNEQEMSKNVKKLVLQCFDYMLLHCHSNDKKLKKHRNKLYPTSGFQN